MRNILLSPFWDLNVLESLDSEKSMSAFLNMNKVVSYINANAILYDISPSLDDNATLKNLEVVVSPKNGDKEEISISPRLKKIVSLHIFNTNINMVDFYEEKEEKIIVSSTTIYNDGIYLFFPEIDLSCNFFYNIRNINSS